MGEIGLEYLLAHRVVSIDKLYPKEILK